MTVSITVAFIGATALILAAVITSRAGSKRQLDQIHILVNSRLTEALTEIKSLRAAKKATAKKAAAEKKAQ